MNGGEEFSNDGSKLGEKKRRLNMEQLKTLEKNFERGSKLERARSKTKQLERDYDELKRQVESLKHENDTLQTQNQKLEAQVKALKSREPIEPINLNKETEGSCSNKSENISGDIRPA
ncbi:unnamed protein product [Brassica oleracea var. botrytis]|uniref:Homeobox-leucine zipper protein n=3 Tax=Brassica TaxID=3705 RepID=A0A078GUW7_BRANA|nr:unnamed protein product [Brassica napus]CDY28428.1 BnaC07g12560D [Brassica napus]VDD36930.1 unnamed protein product [Brassica oleracea]